MKESEYYAYSEMRRYKEFIERVKSERRHVGDMESAHYCDEKNNSNRRVYENS